MRSSRLYRQAANVHEFPDVPGQDKRPSVVGHGRFSRLSNRSKHELRAAGCDALAEAAEQVKDIEAETQVA